MSALTRPRDRRLRLHAQEGATAVEFALVLPLVLGVVHMVVSVALAACVASFLQWGVEHGARAAAVPLDPVARVYRDDAQIAAAVAAAVPLLSVDPADVQVSFPAGRDEGAHFDVNATYRWRNPAAPVLRALFSVDGADDVVAFVGRSSGVRE